MFFKEIQYKMPYYFGILEVLRAMNIVINLSDDEHRDNVSDDENFNELVSVIKRVFENMMDKTSIPVNNSEKNNGNNKEVLTMTGRKNIWQRKVIVNLRNQRI